MNDDENNSNNEGQQGEPQTKVKHYFATCIPGLTPVLIKELEQIGAQHIESSGTSGVYFSSNPTTNNNNDDDVDTVGLKALLWLRTPHRIMELITSTSINPETQDYYIENPIQSKTDLYEFIQYYAPIQSLLGDGRGGLLTLSVNVVLNGFVPKELCHSHYTALTVKNALVDKVRELREDDIRPDVELDDPDVPLVVVLRGLGRSSSSSSSSSNSGGNHYNRRTGGGRDGRQNNNRGGGGRRGQYNNNNNNSSYGREEEERSAGVEVSVYRMLHSGGSLHRRGYRNIGSTTTMENNHHVDGYDDGDDDDNNSTAGKIHKAAMKESLAAGLLLFSGWDLLVNAAKEDGLPAVFVDPMAGSATLSLEAAMIASDYAPGLMRLHSYDKMMAQGGGGGGGSGRKRYNPHKIPPVVRWKGANREQWKQLVLESEDRAKVGMKWAQGDNVSWRKNCMIFANEMYHEAYDLASLNIQNSGLGPLISINEGDCKDWDLGGAKSIVTEDGQVIDDEERVIVPGRTIIGTNPPWGVRLTENIEDSWTSLNLFLRRECNSAEAWILSGSKTATRYLRMKGSRKIPIKTADEDLRWIQYHIFKKKVVVQEREEDFEAVQ